MTSTFSLRLIHNDEIMINIQDWRGRTLLSSACKYGNFDIVKMLVSNKANMNIYDICGVTPLMVAFKYGEYSIANYLINNGANINAFDNYAKNVDLYVSQYNRNDYNYYAMYNLMYESGFKTDYLDRTINLEDNYVRVSHVIENLFKLKN